jgi:hypothetical protein
LFVFDNNEKIANLFNNTKKYKKPLELDKNSSILNDYDLDICNIDESIEPDKSSIIELTYENLDFLVSEKKTSSNLCNTCNNETNNSDECSSRSSNTNLTKSSEDSEEYDEESSNNSNDDDEEEIFCYIDKFPVKMIILESCENTLDDYIISKKIKDDEWESIVLQILFTLITYQKVFEFTHNDLHTNNIVYVSTEKKYLYYKYDNTHYKIPTFGKIYKIIDFGRAIYKFKNKFICSDSYSDSGDATTQYNCEPYLNKNKPIIGPNYSFDLCRLGCSLFDYFIDDLDDIKKLKSPIKKIIIEWVFDDNNKNILYKNNGSERYPDFKLYKMIARAVHKHTPQEVLKKSLFDNYKIAKKKINNTHEIFNIDNLPCMV